MSDVPQPFFIEMDEETAKQMEALQRKFGVSRSAVFCALNDVHDRAWEADPGLTEELEGRVRSGGLTAETAMLASLDACYGDAEGYRNALRVAIEKHRHRQDPIEGTA